MNIVEFSWQGALAGGALIGLAAVLLMASIGRIAGISGIFANTISPTAGFAWQSAFIGGLLASGIVVHWFYQPINLQMVSGMPGLVLAGLLVGFGTRLGSGCTSGHGVCGISRLSPRSIVATLLFIAAGMLTVYLLKIFLEV
ncbi:MAG: YeeE/YedE family protein [Pseudomonadales bacterium]